MIWRIHRECGATRLELGRLWFISCAQKHHFQWILGWRGKLLEWKAASKWQGSEKPGPYWKGCTARLERQSGVDAEDARCHFPNSDCANLSEDEKTAWEHSRAENAAYRAAWLAHLAAAPKENLHEVAAQLPPLEKLKCDLQHRLPESGKPLANIVLTREQSIELVAYIARLEQAAQNATGAAP